MADFGHTHRPRIHRDEDGHLFINLGETGGWSFGRPTVALLETKHMQARLMSIVGEKTFLQ
ncbi:MAG: metallophosphoesterase family protein [Planctomycetaceae bacterium]|nr:metallophosphoesterase family protein [Planctomycetaceae bacterium]